ncbi:uncharacterized MFS-type transporter C09D4.1 isoform X2 [Dendroctonus ponderosae]|uniref:Major facilitator superfamily (MFS) profile domain-containing protein n=1 Tax=Dendroctonus ponderosae TaxID=77166 RepID=A0AAR5NYP8_DENPD|nr:uncharacterized MFS-type transporter C09D4.1 isoform X2 [Dendroctonus ponderosae]
MRTQAYRKRWYVLLVFVYYSCINAIQMTEYSSITETVAGYYQVTNFSVNWTSLLHMVLYPFLMAPAAWIMQRFGLRLAYCCGCLGTAIGIFVKFLAISRQGFCWLLLGQGLTAASSVFIMCLPPKIAAVWFTPSKISTACSLGTMGPNLGNALGYVLAVTIVPNNPDPEEVGRGLKTLNIVSAALITPACLAVVFYLPSKPPQTPTEQQSSPQLLPTQTRRVKYSKGFLLHLLAYSLNLGVFSTGMILLSELVVSYFKGAMQAAGWMGFCMMISGLLGSVIFGVYLDRTHQVACVATSLGSASSILLLLLALHQRSLGFSFFLCGLFGVFANPIIPVGYELGIELSYPSDESTVAGLLFAASQVASVLLAISIAQVNNYWGAASALLSMGALFSLGALLESLVPPRFGRLEALQEQ